MFPDHSLNPSERTYLLSNQDGNSSNDSDNDNLIINQTTPNSLGNDYLTLIQDLHRSAHDLKIPKRNIALLLPSIVISIIAVHTYIGPALEYNSNSSSSSENSVSSLESFDPSYNRILYLIGSLAINALVNIFFMALALIGEKSLHEKQAKEAYSRLRNENQAIYAKSGRVLKKYTLLPLVSIASGFPSFVVDTKEDSQLPTYVPAVIRDIPGVHYCVWAAFAGMQYASINKMVKEQGSFFEKVLILPWLLRKLYYKNNPKAHLNHLLQQKFELLKNCYGDVLASAHKGLLSEIQRQNPQGKLNPIHELLAKNNIQSHHGKQLLQHILSFSQPQKRSRANKVGLYTTQGAISAANIIALLGYFFSTVDAVRKTLNNKGGVFSFYLLAGLVFAPFLDIAIALVSFEVGMAIFDAFVDFGSGLHRTWNESRGVLNFISRAKNIGEISSWERIVKLDLNYQLNPKILSLTLLTAYYLSYYSAPTSLLLNEQELGKDAANNGWIKIPTIIATMIFNAFPADKLMGALTRAYHKMFGKESDKKKLRLDDIMDLLKEKHVNIAAEMFFEILYEIAALSRSEDDNISVEQTDRSLRAFLGNTRPTDIISEKEGGQEFQSLTDVIIYLKEKQERVQSINDKQSLQALVEGGGLFKPATYHNRDQRLEVADGSLYGFNALLGQT